MEFLFNVLKVALILFAIVSVAQTLINERRNYKFVWQVWKRFRIKMLFESFGIILLTGTVAIMLLFVPGLKYGWLNFFFAEGGNMLIKPVLEGSKSTSILIRLFVPIFFFVLMLTLPFFAKFEEKIFRKGYNEWIPILKQSIRFGLFHCLVGVPLALGFALIIPGFFFGYKYKRAFDCNAAILNHDQAEDEAVMVSTSYHTMYNMIFMFMLLLVTLAAI